MDILVKILQLLLSLSILVVFHEMGHFLTAKLFKTRVEKFYLFFDPWFSIFKFKKGDTEYGMGWLPLGGYVKISGMIDESMDKEQMKLPPQPHEFRSKPAWQRLIIMLGGVTVNILLAIAIYIGMLAIWGEEYLSTKEAQKYGITCDSIAYEMGLRNGDKILSIDNKMFKDFYRFPAEVLLNAAKTVQVERDGKLIDVNIPAGFLEKMTGLKKADFVSVRVPFEIGKVEPDTEAMKAGIKVDDRIIGINNIPIRFFDQFRTEIRQYVNDNVAIKLLRNQDTVSVNLKVSEKGTIGVYSKSPLSFYNLTIKKYGFFQAIPAGVSKAYFGVGDYLKQLKLMFSPEVKAYKHVGGFITIGNIFPSTWDWEKFWKLTALLSIMLAILNVLPIPALDGGHTMFLLYEIIARRKPHDKFMEYAQIVGMILLFALLIFANGNDVVKLFQ
jgi:regulator of sigma E protease